MISASYTIKGQLIVTNERADGLSRVLVTIRDRAGNRQEVSQWGPLLLHCGEELTLSSIGQREEVERKTGYSGDALDEPGETRTEDSLTQCAAGDISRTPQLPYLEGGDRSIVQPEADMIVIGAGPKALALAAKREVLRSLGWLVPEILVLEQAPKVAAHWDGTTGFTDGHQLLGTPPEKDAGYPYASTCWADSSAQVNRAMLAFSWQSYLVDQKRSTLGHLRYASWIDRGRPHPPHSEWAKYWEWVARQAQANVELRASVERVALAGEGNSAHWVVEGTQNGTPFSCRTKSLVITGPRDATPLPGQDTAGDRVLDGCSFWKNIPSFNADSNAQVCVIGPGETAATIVVELLKRIGQQGTVYVVSPKGVVYSRGESFDENYYYSDPSGWRDLSLNHRGDFIERTDRSVFSKYAKTAIDLAMDSAVVVTHKGRVAALEPSGEEKVRVVIEYQGNDEPGILLVDYAVVSVGFDSLWWCRDILDDTARATITCLHDHRSNGFDWRHWLLRLFRLRRSPDTPLNERVSASIDADLSLAAFTPKLHLPMLAGLLHGPGFPNLSCLGTLSDRILRQYCRPEESAEVLQSNSQGAH